MRICYNCRTVLIYKGVIPCQHILITAYTFLTGIYRKTIRAKGPEKLGNYFFVKKKCPYFQFKYSICLETILSFFCRHFTLNAIFILDTLFTRRCYGTKNGQNSIELTISDCWIILQCGIYLKNIFSSFVSFYFVSMGLMLISLTFIKTLKNK